MNKHLPFSKIEGTIEVKIRDSSFNVVYEKQVGLKDKKAIISLIKELQIKGADFVSPVRKEQWW